MATADGGVVAKTPDGTAVAFGTNQGPAGLANLFTQSWTGNSYQTGSLESIFVPLIPFAESFWVFAEGNPSNNSTASQRLKIQLHTFKLSGTPTIPLYKYIQSAQDTWSKLSNGTITLLWDKLIDGNIDPCAIPNCLPSDEDNLLYVTDSDRNYLWRKAGYYLQKFPKRLGINIVQISSLWSDKDYGATLGTPDTQSGQFTGPSNIIVVPTNTLDVLKHEIGHVFGLPHVNLSPLNLMCGDTADASYFTQFMNGVPVYYLAGNHLDL